MINILIADDNKDLVELIFKDIIRKNSKFRLTDYTYDGKNALDSIMKYYPDVILLDLKMSKIDGISIIEAIDMVRDKYSPYIIVISGVQEYIKKVYKNKNIYAIINKGNGFSNISHDVNLYLERIDKEINNQKIYKRIKEELKKFNFNNANKGTDYIVDTILLLYDKEEINLSKDIFPILSKKYNVNPINIKWNMEKNFKSMLRYTENNIIKDYFNIEKTTDLTIKNAIKTIVNNLKKENYA